MISSMTNKFISKLLYFLYKVFLLHLLYYTHFLHTVKWGFKKSPGWGLFYIFIFGVLDYCWTMPPFGEMTWPVRYGAFSMYDIAPAMSDTSPM